MQEHFLFISFSTAWIVNFKLVIKTPQKAADSFLYIPPSSPLDLDSN